MTRYLVPLVLFGNGIVAGVMLSTAVGVVPMTLVLPYPQYVQTIRFLWPRYDPFMPIANTVTFVLDIVLVLVTPARALFAAAAVLLAAVMIISVTKNVPINRYVTSLDPDSCPADWDQQDPRVRWRNWNLLRTLLALLALTTNLAAAATLL
jgi:uncharacterized membrane protein